MALRPVASRALEAEGHRPVVGRGHASLLTILDTRHSKPFRDIGSTDMFSGVEIRNDGPAVDRGEGQHPRRRGGAAARGARERELADQRAVQTATYL